VLAQLQIMPFIKILSAYLLRQVVAHQENTALNVSMLIDLTAFSAHLIHRLSLTEFVIVQMVIRTIQMTILADRSNLNLQAAQLGIIAKPALLNIPAIVLHAEQDLL